MNKGKLAPPLRWIFFVSRRFYQVDRKGRTAVTSALSSLGIALGVMALIVVISVMNGFQMSYIDSILEISSFHIRAKPAAGAGAADEAQLESFAQKALGMGEVLSVTPFYEGQTLVGAARGRQQPALIRAVEGGIMQSDKGFAKELKIVSGEFDLSRSDCAVLGYELARALGVFVGDQVSFIAVSGSSSVDLISPDRVFTVTGVFSCGYSDINSSFVFVPQSAKASLFGEETPPVLGIKLKDENSARRVCAALRAQFPGFSAESWEDYNRSFFGVLKVEKNMMMLMIFLIFVVVGVNIYNGLKRMVYERREEICVLAAIGAKPRQIQSLFIMKGFLTGFCGAVPGTALGLLVCANMNHVFNAISLVSYWARYLFAVLFAPDSARFVRGNSLYRVFATIPARAVFGEVFAVALFGVLAAVFAAWGASRGVFRLSLAEVLRDE